MESILSDVLKRCSKVFNKLYIVHNETLKLAAANGVDILVENGDTPAFEKIITLNENISAPIKKGEILGTVTFKNGDKIVGISNLIAQDDIQKEHFIWIILRGTWFFIKILLSFIIFVIILGILLRIFNTIRKFIKKQRKKKGNR